MEELPVKVAAAAETCEPNARAKRRFCTIIVDKFVMRMDRQTGVAWFLRHQPSGPVWVEIETDEGEKINGKQRKALSAARSR